jgi:hypothetical protein
MIKLVDFQRENTNRSTIDLEESEKRRENSRLEGRRQRKTISLKTLRTRKSELLNN